MSAQMNYGYSTPIGQAGGIYDLYPHGISAFHNEADNGVMKFGMAATVGTRPGVDVKAGGDGDFVGMVNNRRTNEHAIFGGIELRNGCTVGVMTYGRGFALLDEDAAPAYGDKVYYTADGLFTNNADNGLTGDDKVEYTEVAGQFLSAASDGIAVIELFNAPQP